MMGPRQEAQAALFYEFSLEDHVPRDHLLRSIDRFVDHGGIRTVSRQPPKGCIHHTDRGSQYCSHEYQTLLRQHGFKLSMSGNGNCYDNSAVETFFKTIKAELIWRRSWQTRREAEATIFQYI